MPDDPGNAPSIQSLRELYQELKRRRVIRTALWYGGLSVTLISITDLLVPILGIPDGSVRTMAILAGVGFPLAVALSWAFHVTPETGGPGARLGVWTRGGLVAAVALLAAAAAGALLRTPHPAMLEAAPSVYEPNRVAILPFEAATPDLQAFADHLHGRLIDGLTAATPATFDDPTALRVISRAGVLPFAGGTFTTDSIGRALSCGTLVHGIVEGDSTEIRVRIRVVDARSAEQLHSADAGVPAGPALAVVDEVSDAAVAILRASLGDIVIPQIKKLGTRNPDAYERLLEGGEAADEFEQALRRGDVEGAERWLERAGTLFDEAARLDADWAEPVVERGLLVGRRAMLAWARGGSVEAEDIDEMIRLAEEALTREPGYPEALYLRGTALFHRVEQSPAGPERTETSMAAERDLTAASRGSRRSARALNRLSELLAFRGELEEALKKGADAYERDPYLADAQATLLRLFEHAFRLGRDAEAVVRCAEGLRRYGTPPFHDCRLMLMAWSGSVAPDPDSAWALVERTLAGYPPPLRPSLEPRLDVLAAATLARGGAHDSARAVLRTVEGLADRSPGVLRALAGTYALIGERARALQVMDELLDVHGEPPQLLESAPELRPLRPDPEFHRRLRGTR